MRNIQNAKSMAKSLRQALADHEVFLGHSQCLEIVARQFGFANWNILAARRDTDPTHTLEMPEGWIVGSRSHPYYRIGACPDEPGTALVESMPGVHLPEEAIGVLMQSVAAEAFRGGKLRMQAQLRGRDVTLGTIWMRIDGGAAGRSLRFDNMMGRKENGAISGDIGWVSRSIVLDVPQEAQSIHFGVLLQGTGKVWARRFTLEMAGASEDITASPRILPRPTNLDFGAQSKAG